MGELGLMGIEVPEAYGGAGLDTIGYVLAMIEICAPMRLTEPSCRSITPPLFLQTES